MTAFIRSAIAGPGRTICLRRNCRSRASTRSPARRASRIITDAAGLARRAQRHALGDRGRGGRRFPGGHRRPRGRSLCEAGSSATCNSTHYRVNELGDIQTEAPVHGGLTDAGAEVIRRCNRRGLVVDVAHGTLRSGQTRRRGDDEAAGAVAHLALARIRGHAAALIIARACAAGGRHRRVGRRLAAAAIFPRPGQRSPAASRAWWMPSGSTMSASAATCGPGRPIRAAQTTDALPMLAGALLARRLQPAGNRQAAGRQLRAGVPGQHGVRRPLTHRSAPRGTPPAGAAVGDAEVGDVRAGIAGKARPHRRLHHRQRPAANRRSPPPPLSPRANAAPTSAAGESESRPHTGNSSSARSCPRRRPPPRPGRR